MIGSGLASRDPGVVVTPWLGIQSGCCHGLSLTGREQFAVLRATGLSLREIGRRLGRVARFSAVNSGAEGGYRPVHAEGSYLARRQRPALLERDQRLRRFVHQPPRACHWEGGLLICKRTRPVLVPRSARPASSWQRGSPANRRPKPQR